ncbi:MAG: response regulator transcription factor [Chloroflexi bacterium]|nr:response regulator transcription factor [Chloroflexota bacterium]
MGDRTDRRSAVTYTPDVLVIDDDPKITSLLRRALRAEGYDVRTAQDGAEGLARARERQPDLVVLDWLMPGMDGLEVCRRLREQSDVPILMLTARDETADRVRGLDSGADDYLVKPFALDELLARVRALLRRREQRERRVLQYADLALDLTSRIATRGERTIELTTREFELLSYFLRHPGVVLSQEQLLDHVWEGQFDNESNVLHVYVGYLRNKLEAGGEPRLIHTVRGVGYVLRE